jgi:putative ABC transport system permease protein
MNDMVELELQGERRRFRVAGIAQPTGVFQIGFDTNDTIVVPLEYLASLYSMRGKVSQVYVRTRADSDIPSVMAELRTLYPRYMVRVAIDPVEQEQFASYIKTPLLLMSIMVLLMSVFIVYNTFKVITVERLPVIGTFRSIGAARKTTDVVRILESLVYGVFSGIAGCFLGTGILAVMTNLMAYNPWAGAVLTTRMQFTAQKLRRKSHKRRFPHMNLLYQLGDFAISNFRFTS